MIYLSVGALQFLESYIIVLCCGERLVLEIQICPAQGFSESPFSCPQQTLVRKH